MQRSQQITDRLGFKGTTAATLAAVAVTQAEFGNSARARELATSSGALVRDRGNLESVALALAMTGDVSRAQAIEDDLDHRFPDDLLLHQVNLPCVRALIELQRKAPEQSVQALEAVRPYESGASVAFLPTYIRGQAYLQAKRATEAAAEFQKTVDHPGSIRRRRAVAGKAWPRPGLRITGDSAKARGCLSGFPGAVEGRGLRYSNPQRSQSGIRQAAVNP